MVSPSAPYCSPKGRLAHTLNRPSSWNRGAGFRSLSAVRIAERTRFAGREKGSRGAA